MIRSSDDETSTQLPFIGKINDIFVDRSGDLTLKVRYYYRPHETRTKRQPHHGACEVFSTNHYEAIAAETVLGRAIVCAADAFDDVLGAIAVGKHAVLPEHAFYCRQHYHVNTGEFTPALEVNCVCGRPNNPDLVMVCCEQCNVWFHTECVGLSDRQASLMPSFVCSPCEAHLAAAEDEDDFGDE